jgi:hypothetical protein
MKITNNYNLPSAFVNLSDDSYEPRAKHYGVTTILKPTREILLERRHDAEMTEDVADRVWLVFGTAVHKILEEADKTGMAEIGFEQPVIDDYILSGKIDLYNATEQIVEDYKSATTTKIIRGDFEDWRKQGLEYAWLLSKVGKVATKLRFHALLKDWTPRDLKAAKEKGTFYPEHSIWTWEHDIKPEEMVEIEQFIKNKFTDLINNESVADDALPLCSPEDRWNAGDKFAVIKVGGKKASVVCNSKVEAESYIKDTSGYEIQVREGEDKKCINYCPCCEFCSYWKQKYGSKPTTVLNEAKEEK